METHEEKTVTPSAGDESQGLTEKEEDAVLEDMSPEQLAKNRELEEILLAEIGDRPTSPILDEDTALERHRERESVTFEPRERENDFVNNFNY